MMRDAKGAFTLAQKQPAKLKGNAVPYGWPWVLLATRPKLAR
jgi:hypothetical protein